MVFAMTCPVTLYGALATAEDLCGFGNADVVQVAKDDGSSHPGRQVGQRPKHLRFRVGPRNLVGNHVRDLRRDVLSTEERTAPLVQICIDDRFARIRMAGAGSNLGPGDVHPNEHSLNEVLGSVRITRCEQSCSAQQAPATPTYVVAKVVLPVRGLGLSHTSHTNERVVRLHAGALRNVLHAHREEVGEDEAIALHELPAPHRDRLGQ